MSTYLDYQNQLHGFQSVHQTVKTVEKISAAHLKKIKKQVVKQKENVRIVTNIINRLSLFTEIVSNPFNINPRSKQKILLVISSNKGLVGGLFHNLVDLVVQHQDNYHEIWVVGSKGTKVLDQAGVQNYKQIDNQNFHSEIILKIITLLKKLSVWQFDVIYLENLSVSIQKASFSPLLPVTNKSIKSYSIQKSRIGLPIFEDNKYKIMKMLVTQYISFQLHYLFVQTKQAELSARMVTSEHAAAKAEDLVNTLKLHYLTQRRHTLTQQQLANYSSHLK